MKSLNKKATYENSKKKGPKSGGDQSSPKKEGDHPNNRKAPKQGDKKDVKYKGHI